MSGNEEPLAMAPAYGGMFRPRSPRRWPIVVVAIVVVAAAAFGVWYSMRPQPRPVGVPCTLPPGDDDQSETYAGCNGGLCIREVDDTAYCSEECKTDDECPAGFVCDPTRSRRRRACMEEGADVTPVDAGAVDGARLFRRKRAPTPF
jgi:Cys-rich repeat protein